MAAPVAAPATVSHLATAAPARPLVVAQYVDAHIARASQGPSMAPPQPSRVRAMLDAVREERARAAAESWADRPTSWE